MSTEPAEVSWVSAEFGITLGDGRSPVGLSMAQLIALALRRNPKRAQLLVSRVLGKHLPADPRVVAGTGRLLGALVGRALTGTVGPIPADWAEAAEATISGREPGALLELLDSPLTLNTTAGGPALTLGFAETATSLGHLVAGQLGSAYLHSTRRTDGEVPVSAEFSEPHSHATGHLLRPNPASLLTGTGAMVLVDDELSTGRTALNVIEALHAMAPRDRYILAGLVDLRSDADDAVRAELARRLGCRIDVVSLVRGSITVPPDARERVWVEVGSRDEGVASEAVPAAGDSGAAGASSAAGIVAGGVTVGAVRQAEQHDQPAGWSRLVLPWPAGVPMGGRHGFTPADRPAFEEEVRTAAATIAEHSGDASRILVIGTEELMYLPLMIALELARDGLRDMAFQSTTRSPVHAVDRVGYPIRRRIDFTSTDLQAQGGMPVHRHVYNAGRPAAGSAGLQEADLIVIVDDGHATDGPTGLPARVAAATGRPVLLAVVETAPTGEGFTFQRAGAPNAAAPSPMVQLVTP